MVNALVLLLSSLLSFSLANDQGFRFETGYCQKERKPGFNPDFFGECGNMTSWRLIHEHHKGLNFTGASLNASYTYMSFFINSKFSHLAFRRAVMLQTRIHGGEAVNMDMRGSTIKGSSFDSVKMINLLATGTRFEKTEFKNCDLQGANFWGSSLQEVSFAGSDLRAVNFKNTFLLFNDFTGAKFNKTTILPFSQEEALKRGMVKVD